MRLIDSTRLSESAEPKFFVSGILEVSRNLLGRSKLARVYPRDIVHGFIRKSMEKSWFNGCDILPGLGRSVLRPYSRATWCILAAANVWRILVLRDGNGVPSDRDGGTGLR